ncbi:hybrid sensor histidine kinase/response regulator, partial [Bradyrhizobium sp. UFLA05-109]
MTAETDHNLSREPVAVHEPPQRSGSIALVFLVAATLVAVAVGLMTLGRTQAQPYILGILAVLAMVGLFNLFAFAAGIVRFADRNLDDPIIARISDHAFDGLAVTDPRGHVVYSNAAYLTMTGASGPQDVRPVERVF